jgi:hypothetical protein
MRGRLIVTSSHDSCCKLVHDQWQQCSCIEYTYRIQRGGKLNGEEIGVQSLREVASGALIGMTGSCILLACEKWPLRNCHPWIYNHRATTL